MQVSGELHTLAALTFGEAYRIRHSTGGCLCLTPRLDLVEWKTFLCFEPGIAPPFLGPPARKPSRYSEGAIPGPISAIIRVEIK
jgi:hypothetical protein